MSESVRILIVEDEVEWSDYLDNRFRQLFETELNAHATIERALDAQKALQLIGKIKETGAEPYDLVSLDVFLGEAEAKRGVTGMRVLEEINAANAAWMVAMLTGIEGRNRRGRGDSDAEDLVREIQEDLRARARKNFPPERLVALEKPTQKLRQENTTEMHVLEKRLKQVVLIYDQLSKTRNIFRELRLPCEEPWVAVIDREKFLMAAKQQWEEQEAVRIKKQKAKGKELEAREFDITQLRIIPAQDGILVPRGGREETLAREMELLKMKSEKRRADTIWVKSELISWQVRFKCGDIITVPNDDGLDGRGLKTVQAFFRWPDIEMRPGTVNALINGNISEPPKDDDPVVHQHFAQAPASRYVEQEGSAADEIDNHETNEDDDIDAASQHAGELRQRTEEWDTTDKDSSERYKRELRRKRAELESASGVRATELKNEITALENELKKLRTGAQSLDADFVRQAKTRAIEHLRQNGAVALANHIESWMKPRKAKWTYDPSPRIDWKF